MIMLRLRRDSIPKLLPKYQPPPIDKDSVKKRAQTAAVMRCKRSIKIAWRRRRPPFSQRTLPTPIHQKRFNRPYGTISSANTGVSWGNGALSHKMEIYAHIHLYEWCSRLPARSTVKGDRYWTVRLNRAKKVAPFIRQTLKNWIKNELPPSLESSSDFERAIKDWTLRLPLEVSQRCTEQIECHMLEDAISFCHAFASPLCASRPRLEDFKAIQLVWEEDHRL